MTDPDPASESDPDPPADADANLDPILDAIHDHLAATQELPVEREASRWIGEAEAVARDLAASDLARSVVAERLGHVESLLGEVESTGDEAADQHLERARSLTIRTLDVLRGE